jgi:hypothetical protein
MSPADAAMHKPAIDTIKANAVCLIALFSFERAMIIAAERFRK